MSDLTISGETIATDANAAVDTYLNALLTIAECLEAANPEVGPAYRQRLARLRARLAFQPSPAALRESAIALSAELRDYAAAVNRQNNRYTAELRREIVTLGEIIEAISKRQDFYGKRLRQFAAQMELTRYPSDPDHLTEVLELQAAGLRSCVESLTTETTSWVAHMRHEMQALETRLAATQSVDPVTGLINRAEMMEQIGAYQAAGAEFVLLLFEITPAGNEVMRMAADRMVGQFRQSDRVARWGQRQLLVLFRGNVALAEERAEKILPRIAAPYQLMNGESVDVQATSKVLDAERAAF